MEAMIQASGCCCFAVYMARICHHQRRWCVVNAGKCEKREKLLHVIKGGRKIFSSGVEWEKEEILLFITFLSSHRIVLCRRCQLSFVISSVISDSQIQWIKAWMTVDWRNLVTEIRNWSTNDVCAWEGSQTVDIELGGGNKPREKPKINLRDLETSNWHSLAGFGCFTTQPPCFPPLQAFSLRGWVQFWKVQVSSRLATLLESSHVRPRFLLDDPYFRVCNLPEKN